MKRGFYCTSQQKYIIEYLKEHNNEALSVEKICSALCQNSSIGKATVYRTLDRLIDKGCAIKVPAFEGKTALYRYIGEETNPKEASMVCLCCGRTIAIECNHLIELVNHINADHGFSLDTRHTLFYGYCSACKEKK